MTVYVGAYARAGQLLSFLIVVIVGVFAFFMKKYGYSRPALALGFVLGEQAEIYMLRSIDLHGPFFFMTPGCLVLLAIIIALPFYPYWKGIFSKI